ncbi:MAG: FadR/GntR family transcriptional regulator [Actinomycetales bacterium]
MNPPPSRFGPAPLDALEAVAPQTAVTAVARRLLDHFTSGGFAPGQRLPAERQLAAQLGVGRSAVREALAALEILGIVSVRPGSGTYLKSSASELLPQTLSWGFMLGEPRTRELIELRHGLEVQAARLAAANATDAEREELAVLVQEMADHGEDYDAFVAADMHFHQTLAQAGDNSLLAGLLSTVRSLLRVWVERSVRDAAETERTIGEHRRILAAVRDGDATAAAAAMDEHMNSAATRLLNSLDSQRQPGTS